MIINKVCLGSFENGCDCALCRDDAFADGVRMIPMPVDLHGTEDGYNHWGCRCPSCRGCHREALRTRLATRAVTGRFTYREEPIPEAAE